MLCYFYHMKDKMNISDLIFEYIFILVYEHSFTYEWMILEQSLLRQTLMLQLFIMLMMPVSWWKWNVLFGQSERQCCGLNGGTESMWWVAGALLVPRDLRERNKLECQEKEALSDNRHDIKLSWKWDFGFNVTCCPVRIAHSPLSYDLDYTGLWHSDGALQSRLALKLFC